MLDKLSLFTKYHVALMDDKPYLVWNFNLLLQGIQLMLSMMLTDEHRPIWMCRNCGQGIHCETIQR